MAQYTAMQIMQPHHPLNLVVREIPAPGPGELQVEVTACGICRTDVHVLDGEIGAKYPVVPGHEVVGRVSSLGSGVNDFVLGQRIGIPWLGGTCGKCQYCLDGHENLCDFPEFTGATRDGGYASHAIARADFCFALPLQYSDVDAAPLLCAGLIGWRALCMAGDARRIGFYGFGAAAHILCQIARWQGRDVYAFTRPGDEAGQQFARSLGCTWAGSSSDQAPILLDAALIFAPVGALVPAALRAIRKGGTVICAGIHMSDIPSFAYADLWHERHIRSVANLTRGDARSFFEIADRIPIKIKTEVFRLDQANLALDQLRAGKIAGAAVLVP